MMRWLRKNIGTIVAGFGFVFLCILTFGDIGEILTEVYWENVRDNLTSIGFLSVALTMIQTSIKQGLSEQALQKGLNTEETSNKYKEHRQYIKDNNERMIYLPYFLQIYNERHTRLKKREFLIDTNYSSEEALYASGRKKLIRKYKKIRIYLTASRIKWATTEIVYNKQGQIITLAEYRNKRTLNSIVLGLVFMIGTTLLARGLFFDESDVPLWEKFVKLLTYIVTIVMSSILPIIKEYEKGAFGVPNELEEINEIWREFTSWKVPQYLYEEIKQEVENEEKITKTDDSRTNIQIKQKESEVVRKTNTNNLLVIDGTNDVILLPGSTE